MNGQFDVLYETSKYSVVYRPKTKGYLVKLLSKLHEGKYTNLIVRDGRVRIEETNIGEMENERIIESNTKAILNALAELGKKSLTK